MVVCHQRLERRAGRPCQTGRLIWSHTCRLLVEVIPDGRITGHDEVNNVPERIDRGMAQGFIAVQLCPEGHASGCWCGQAVKRPGSRHE
jgi:hypothetical protein